MLIAIVISLFSALFFYNRKHARKLPKSKPRIALLPKYRCTIELKIRPDNIEDLQQRLSPWDFKLEKQDDRQVSFVRLEQNQFRKWCYLRLLRPQHMHCLD